MESHPFYELQIFIINDPPEHFSGDSERIGWKYSRFKWERCIGDEVRVAGLVM